jgi:hypothetical protein
MMNRILSFACILAAFCSIIPVSRANAGGGGLDIKDVEVGSLITSSFGPAIYYYGYDGKRYVFPNEKVYFSWFKDFRGVKRVGDKSLATVPIGGNVTYKPGVKLVKIQTDPRVYAVANGKILRWITSEALARELYGADWAADIYDVPDAFFADYEIGRPIFSASEYDPDWDIYAHQSLSYLIDMQLRDPSELPEDIPLYPKGSVTSAAVYDGERGRGTVYLRSDEDAASVIGWYEEEAPRKGWEPAKKSLSERKVEELGRSSMARFQKQEQGETYELSVFVTGSEISVSRSIATPKPDASMLPSFVPVYDKGEIAGVEEIGEEGVLGYIALTEERMSEICAYMDGRLLAESWREINRADAAHGLVRLYERPFGNEMKNLILVIFTLPNLNGWDFSYVLVAYGSSEALSEQYSFADIAEALKEADASWNTD